MVELKDLLGKAFMGNTAMFQSIYGRIESVTSTLTNGFIRLCFNRSMVELKVISSSPQT